MYINKKTLSKSTFNDNNYILQQAIGYCLRILAKKDYTKGEISKKLETRKYSQNIIFETIQYLESKNFIDDRRVADAIVRYYYGIKGKIWIREKMRERMIPTELIVEIINNLPSELNTLTIEQITSLKRVLEKKYEIESWHPIPYEKRAKVFQYLVRRGFSQPIALLNYISRKDIFD